MTRLLFILTFLFINNTGICCTCEPLMPITEADYSDYDLIVRGSVVKYEEYGGVKTMSIRVDTLFKGGAHEGTTIRVSSFGSCSLSAHPGQEWLVFAREDEYGYRTGLCSRSVQLSGLDPSGWLYEQIVERSNDDLMFLRLHPKVIKEPSVNYLPLIMIGVIGLFIVVLIVKPYCRR